MKAATSDGDHDNHDDEVQRYDHTRNYSNDDYDDNDGIGLNDSIMI